MRMCFFAKKAGKRCCSHAVGIERGNFKLIRRLVHRIKGAGGGYVTHWACRLNGWSDLLFRSKVKICSNIQQQSANDLEMGSNKHCFRTMYARLY